MGLGILDISVFHRTLNVLSNEEWACGGISVPPLDQFSIICSLVSNLPIQLWHAIVHPTIVDPQKNVGIEIVVVLQSSGIAAHRRISSLIAINTKGRDAKLHPRLYFMDGCRHLLNEQIHVVAPPIAFAESLSVILVEPIIVKRLSGNGIRIEVVIDMQSVNVVSRDDILHHITYIISVFLQSRIQDKLAIIGNHSFGMA